MVVIKITFAHPDTQAAFELAGIPNGTCTSSFGARLLQKSPCHYIFRLDDSRPSVRRSLETSFADIRALGRDEVVDISILKDVMKGNDDDNQH